MTVVNDKPKIFNAAGRFICQCDDPTEHPSPLKQGTCCRCAGSFDLSGLPWASSDETIKDFWDSLERGLFPTVKDMAEGSPTLGKFIIPEPPEWFQQLRALAMAREREGRKLYGLAYLNRDNLHPDANEEASDYLNYLFFDHLLTIFLEGTDDDFDLVLDTAASVVEAYRKTQRLRAKRRGAP